MNKAGVIRRVVGPRAERAFDADLAVFGRFGWRVTERPGPLRARIECTDATDLELCLAQEGRIFGGSYALEARTAEPVLPASAGLTARARGVVRTRGVRFRGRDAAARELAAALDADAGVQSALVGLHFERVFVDPDGRPGLRHLGGSLVWVLLPPVIRATPLIEDQAAGIVSALRAFAAASPTARAGA